MNDNYFAGAVADMSNATYHQQPHIGSSGFKLLARSPAHFWASYVDPHRERRPPTPLMKIGTAWHAAIFEPEKFATDYSEIPEGLDRRTKEGKALWAELEASGKEPLTTDGWAQIVAMAAAARRHPVSQVIFGLPGGHAEMSIFWVDPDTGAPCRIRPDYHVEPCAMFPNGLIIDGKSNDDSSPAGFAKSAMNSEMFYQAAFYSDGFQQHYGTKEPPVFAWLAQEREAPFATAYYSAGADFVQYGRKKYRRLLALFAHCMHSGQWPGYPAVVQPLDLPGWAVKAIEGEVAA